MCIWPTDIKCIFTNKVLVKYWWDGKIHKKICHVRPPPPVKIKEAEIFVIDDLVIMYSSGDMEITATLNE